MTYISLKEVSFKYPERNNYAVNNFSIELKKREKIKITGFNGNGKSALIELMLGILKPKKGNTTIDNKLIEKYTLSEIGKNQVMLCKILTRCYFVLQ